MPVSIDTIPEIVEFYFIATGGGNNLGQCGAGKVGATP